MEGMKGHHNIPKQKAAFLNNMKELQP